MTELFSGTQSQLNMITIRKKSLMFNDRQLELIAEAVEDYGVLVSEEVAEECCEILEIIDAYFHNKNFKK
tara:strand:- start:146 stop:355 length:210 start_codon:yes stop_codon:yes gene_type:complete